MQIKGRFICTGIYKGESLLLTYWTHVIKGQCDFIEAFGKEGELKHIVSELSYIVKSFKDEGVSLVGRVLAVNESPLEVAFISITEGNVFSIEPLVIDVTY